MLGGSVKLFMNQAKKANFEIGLFKLILRILIRKTRIKSTVADSIKIIGIPLENLFSIVNTKQKNVSQKTFGNNKWKLAFVRSVLNVRI